MIGYAILTLLATLGWASAWYFRSAYFEERDAYGERLNIRAAKEAEDAHELRRLRHENRDLRMAAQMTMTLPKHPVQPKQVTLTPKRPVRRRKPKKED